MTMEPMDWFHKRFHRLVDGRFQNLDLAISPSNMAVCLHVSYKCHPTAHVGADFRTFPKPRKSSKRVHHRPNNGFPRWSCMMFLACLDWHVHLLSPCCISGMYKPAFWKIRKGPKSASSIFQHGVSGWHKVQNHNVSTLSGAPVYDSYSRSVYKSNNHCLCYL